MLHHLLLTAFTVSGIIHFAMQERLARERGNKFVGVTELAAAAGRILHESGPAQSRGTVSSVPDERTVRFYLSEGLLAPAQERQGAASVFGYLQLLQLLVVKQLQAKNLPIRQIREALAGRAIEELERWLGVEGEAAAKNEAQKFLESLLAQPAPPQNIIRKKTAPPASLQTMWQRHEIEPGLEIHLRAGYQSPQDDNALRRLLQRIRDIIEG
jgi:DNA-binding transcriptional MerR regulator